MEEIITPYIFSTVSLTVFLVSLLFQGMLWRRSNRPVVSAYICDIEPGKSKTSFAFKLVLVNTGNMPATNVRLVAKQSDIENIFEDGTDESLKKVATDCFDHRKVLPLLLNNEKIETALGFSQDVGNKKRTGLKYESWLSIKIIYYDLNLRKYTSLLKLRIRDREGFGGAVFNIQKN